LLKLGLLVNPYAGLGGPAGLKGSDGASIRREALARGAAPRALARARRALAVLAAAQADVQVVSCEGQMGADALQGLKLDVTELSTGVPVVGTGEDTRVAATVLADAGIDLLVFAGGDGTARDVLDAVADRIPVLGIPSGVKMHSAVYAVSPEAAGELLLVLSRAGLVDVQLREVRDIDEEAFRQGVVKTRFYGELLAPEEGRFLQRTKVAGRESSELVAAEIADDIVSSMQPGRLYLIGPGSTTAAIMEQLRLPNTLLGVDVVADGALLVADASEADLLRVLETHRGGANIIVTAIGGQGHIFGRGNQQLSPAVIRRVGEENIIVVAGKGKLADLGGRPLLVDTNDSALDMRLCGYRRVITGYRDEVLYPVATTA
jgi:predicted polyphosphate/ATP-dependent NAD kinase